MNKNIVLYKAAYHIQRHAELLSECHPGLDPG